MMFAPRTTPVKEGEQPYVWGIPSVYQCSWFCYYRAYEALGSFPTWWDRATKTGSYPNAKEWLANYRDPWQVKSPDYTPVAGDILVYDGEYGHVIFMETDVMTSEYRNGDPDSFRNAKLGDYRGELLGILHYPYEPLNPVERNENVDQIQCSDDALRIRTKPSLNAEIVGHVQLGYYNVLQAKEADGYTWYQLAKDRWCADVGVEYFPATDDIMKEIERFVNATKQKIKGLESENNELKDDMKKISNITERWL